MRSLLRRWERHFRNSEPSISRALGGRCGDGVETFTGPQSLIQLVLVARDADLTALAEKLCLQEYLDGLDPEELAAVYRDMLLPEAVR